MLSGAGPYRCTPHSACRLLSSWAARAVGALYGPLHGGANEAVLRMLERIGSKDKVPAFVEGVKNRKEKMFGFGHRCVRGSMGCGRPAPGSLLAL